MSPTTPATLAHELSDMLTVIAGCSELVLAHLPAGDPDRALLEEIRRAVARTVALTHRLVTPDGRAGAEAG